MPFQSWQYIRHASDVFKWWRWNHWLRWYIGQCIFTICVAHLVCTALTDAIPAYFTWWHGGFTWGNVLNLKIAPDLWSHGTLLYPDFNPSYNLGCRWIWSLRTSGSENQIIGNLLVMIIPSKIFIIVFSIFNVGKSLGGGFQVVYSFIFIALFIPYTLCPILPRNLEDDCQDWERHWAATAH